MTTRVAAIATAATDRATATTRAVETATAGIPNTGRTDMMTNALVGLDLVLLGATMLLAVRCMSRRV
jgi:LPXTG-motif cell wall-anchored protein